MKNVKYAQVVKAYEQTFGNYGAAISLLRGVVGHVDSSTVKDAVKLEKNWQAFLTSDEYKGASKDAQDLMRKSMQRIRAKCGYTCDRKGVITVKKTVTRGTKGRDDSKPETVNEEHAEHSVANPAEAAKIVAAISEWQTALGAVIDAFGHEMPPEILATLRHAIFGIAKPPTPAKATKAKAKA